MRKSILILLFALLGVLSARADHFEVDGIYYNSISDTSVEVWGSSFEYSGSLVISATVEYEGTTYVVTSIKDNAFESRGLTSVTIPESVTSIGNRVFGGCRDLTTVVWNAITCHQVGDEMGVPVAELPFFNCENITSITFGNQVEYIPIGLCYGMNKLTTVTIPESVTTIGSSAFYGCSGLTSVTIPESVDYIGNYAFYGCSGLTSVTIPEGVDTIGGFAFSGCTSISNPLYNSKVFAYMPQNYSGEYAIPSGIQSIVGGAFSDCSGLILVTIPESVTAIGDYAFSDCSGLILVTIPESVTAIGDYAFSDCSGLILVTIPESVTAIGDYAFYGCSGLTSVTIPESVTAIGDYAFYGCSGLTSVTIPESVTSIGYSAFYGCTGLTTVTIPESVTSIGERVFYGCSGLTTVTIPESVTTIGYSAFYGCSGLTTVTIPESVTSISSSAFYGCSGLMSVEWNAVACQDFSYSSPFSEDTSLTSIIFGNQVEHIPAYLCNGMDKLTSMTIPESVTSIGKEAFYGCTGLTSVEWNAVSCQDFEYYSYGEKHPFYDCENITSMTFGNQVERIPAYLCYGMNKLRLVTIPASVTSIGSNVFGDCDGLISVTSLAKLPPYCEEENVFGSASEYYQTLYVPRGSKSAYASAKEWHKFSKIEEIETYTVTVLANDADMGKVSGGDTYVFGAEAILAAIPNTGYHFVKWSDENTDNPRTLTVTEDITLTAIFAKDEEKPDDPDNPDNPDNPTANENAEADNFHIYVQDRTIHLSEDRGTVQVYNMAGQCVYNGHATAIPVQHAGVYVVVTNDKRIKVLVK